MQVINIFNAVISVLFVLCYAYQFLYIPAELFIKSKKSKNVKKHRYAVLISARNEKNVLGNLLDSISTQTYGRESIDIFVIADNCTDSTALVAREHGAYVYERFNKVKVGKGYALDTLLQHIKKDFSKEKYHAYFVFDADNVLEENYFEEMNKTFSEGYDVVCSYRNSKNYGDNWISAGNALWFMRESRYLNGARMKLGLSPTVSGTGFMVSRRILEQNGGWKYFTLTEDLEFTAHNIIKGAKFGYCENAVFYDEQPTRFSQSWKQRLRWSKGYLQVSAKYGCSMLKMLFKRGFSCVDFLLSILPAYILTFVSVIFNTGAAIGLLLSGNDITPMVLSAVSSFGNMCLTAFIIGGFTTITEWKKIQCPTRKKLFYMFTFPFFMLTYVPISVQAVFGGKVEWTPIKHSVAITAKEIKQKQKG